VPIPSGEQRLAPGVQTGTFGQEQVSHAQLVLQTWKPYWLHVSWLAGAHPCPSQAPSCQAPLTHVCVSLPQLPHAFSRVAPSRHAPQAPALHTPLVSQVVPSASFVHTEVLAGGWQLWQLLPGFAAPAAYTVAPMKHPAAHCPAWHTSPAPQLAPSALAFAVHAVVLAGGWQLWHGLPGLAAPAW
jgi:hypothetical protein